MKRATHEDAADPALEARALAVLPEPDDAEKRNVRWAFAVAVGLHLVLFSLQLPEMSAQLRADPGKPVFAVKPVPYQPPEPETRETLPQELPIKVPVPDPTPDELEPLRPAPEIVVELDVPISDYLLDFPEAPPEPERDRPLVVGGPVKPPVRIHSPSPRYTEIARRARIEGHVIVSAVIDRQGRVTSTEILKPLPMGLDQEALAAIRTWTFEPATLKGEPVAVFYNLTVHFKLN